MSQALMDAAGVPVERQPAVSAMLQGFSQEHAKWPLTYRFALPLAYLLPLLLVTAAQESNFDPNATGDDGASVGLLQFNSVNNGLIASTPAGSWRTVPALQGQAAALYIRQALDKGATAWITALLSDPYNAIRAMWRYGTDPTNIGRDIGAGLRDGWESKGEGVFERIEGWLSWALMVALGWLILPVVLVASVAVYAVYRMTSKRGKRK